MDTIEMIVHEFTKEVDEAVKSLITILGIDPSKITNENSKELKEYIGKTGFTFKHVIHRPNPLKSVLMLMKGNEMIAGYLVYVDLKMNVLRRTLLEDGDELDRALAFLKSDDTSITFERVE